MTWEQEFDKQFMMSTDNGSGPEFLFKIYPPDEYNVFPSGSLTIARPEHIKEFIQNEVIDVLLKFDAEISKPRIWGYCNRNYDIFPANPMSLIMGTGISDYFKTLPIGS